MSEAHKQAVTGRAYRQDRVVLIGENQHVNSAALLGEGETLAIQHRGECYILRQTRAGKLILTK